jgi:hypothetical protein
MKQVVTVELGEFALNALAEGGGGDDHASRLLFALRYYLRDAGSGRLEWPYPEQLREGPVGETVELSLEVDEGLWGSFAREAARQDISTDRLATHAAIYFAADRDAGRVTQRIVDSLGEE